MTLGNWSRCACARHHSNNNTHILYSESRYWTRTDAGLCGVPAVLVVAVVVRCTFARFKMSQNTKLPDAFPSSKCTKNRFRRVSAPEAAAWEFIVPYATLPTQRLRCLDISVIPSHRLRVPLLFLQIKHWQRASIANIIYPSIDPSSCAQQTHSRICKTRECNYPQLIYTTCQRTCFYFQFFFLN